MVGIRVSMFALILFVCLISPMGFAKSVTLKTINVSVQSDYGILQAEIHFDERDLDVALKAERVIKTDLIKAINYFQYVPRTIVHFNVDPYLRLTNGNARTFPTDIINLYKFPPSNNEHLIVMEDWLTGLIFHEYVHVTHLDQTRDFLELGRNIFGSIAKFPVMIVPRWFTEGIAVWAESHLSKNGRLNNPLFRKELLIQFLRADYCKTIDCLDEPGLYPNGSLAYWAGAHFMEYMEEKKPGTIKCLVEENSSKIPFLLNRVFSICTGQNAEDSFAEFRERLINSQPPQTPENEAWGDKISNAFGSDDLQKGIYLDGNTLFKVEQYRQSEALVSYDLQENVNMLVAQFSYPISDISGMTTVPQVDNEISDNGKFLIVAFNEDPYFRGANPVWKLVNTETLQADYTLPLKNDPSYVIGLGNNRFLTASFVNNRWIIERQKVDMAKGTVTDSDILHYFGADVNLAFFKKVGQKVLVKLNRKELGTALYISDLTLESLYKVYESKTFFDLPIQNENFFVLREQDSLRLFEFNDGLKKVSVSEMGKDLLNRVTSAEIGDERVLVLENRLKTKDMSLKESMAYLKRNAGKAQNVEMIQVSFKNEEVPLTLDQAKAESFPKAYHFIPHYWFIAFGSSENLSSYGAMTTFSDPMDLTILDAAVLTYPEESKVGGHFTLNHKLAPVSDLWSLSAYFNHEYSKTDFSSNVDQTTEWSVGTHYAILMKRWTMVPGLFFGQTKTDDFISDRTVKSVGVSNVLSYNAQTFDDVFQKLIFQLKFENNQPDIGDDYYSVQSLLKLEGRFYERLVGGVKFSYGKLFKDGFRQGVIYGGGVNSLDTIRWHEFYGLPYNNAYGNEIFTFRLHLDYNFWYINRGWGLVPVFFKEAHLLLGRESLYADRIILEKTLYKEQTIHSMFAGARLKTNLFYFVPTDIDVIYSNIQRPNGGKVNQVDFLVNASFE
nr:peptidase MA [Bacteriovorax sp. HI3]